MTRAELLQHWLGELIPLWRTHGFDEKRGGFHNRLSADFSPASDPFKRLLVQCRQIWAFSVAARRGDDREALALAQRGYDYLLERFADPRHGGFVLTVTLDGEPLDRSKDLYAHAFVIFALAELHRSSGDTDPLERAREVFELLDARLRDRRHGGFLDAAEADWTPRAGRRRQNPHMHLLEALLRLDEIAPDPLLRQECARIVELLETRWLDAHGVLGEFFDDDWSGSRGVDGAVVEPGHHFEWVWLLHRHAAASGARQVLGAAQRLFDFAQRHGVDQDGGVFDQIDRQHRVVRGSKRLWPQTERITALAARLHAGRDPRDADALQAALDYVFARYVDPVNRGWHEQLDREGRVSSEYMNATSVYHVTSALVAAMDALG